MLRHFIWMHEMVYTVAGQPAVYDDISITLFGYKLAMEAQKRPSGHSRHSTSKSLWGMQSYMARSQSMHSMLWLQQLEHGRVPWADREAIFKFRRALV